MSAVFTLIKSVTLGYFFYIYAFDNPDLVRSGVDCYARQNDDIGYPASFGNEYVNVTSKFEMWFLFGFVAECCWLLISLIGLVHAIMGTKVIFTIQ